VTARLALDKALPAQWIDEVFQTHHLRQYSRKLLFSTVVELMTLVTLGLRPSLHAAARKMGEQMTTPGPWMMPGVSGRVAARHRWTTQWPARARKRLSASGPMGLGCGACGGWAHIAGNSGTAHENRRVVTDSGRRLRRFLLEHLEGLAHRPANTRALLAGGWPCSKMLRLSAVGGKVQVAILVSGEFTNMRESPCKA